MTASLIYHDLVEHTNPDSVGMPGPIAARYKHDPAQFQEHLAAIEQTGLNVGVIGPDGAWPDVALTFDDGGASAPVIAAMLEQRGWRGHFFVTTGRIGTPGFVTEDDIRALVAQGHVVGSHSHTHPRYMGRLSKEELDSEWRRSRDELERIMDGPPDIAALPGGFLSAAVIDSAANAGYRVLMTSEPSTRRHRVKGIVHVGRYTIWTTTSARTAAAYARGSASARVRLWSEWKAKQLSKRTLPGAYRTLQRLRAGGA